MKEHKEGDMMRQVTVTQTVFEWKINVDGTGDWYVKSGPQIVVQCPNWQEVEI